MDALFGKSQTPAEKVKGYQRSIKKSCRDMDRETKNLERAEKKLMTDIKKAAKDGQVDSAKIMAKDLVRTRGYIKKMHKMKSHLEAVSLRLTTMQSNQQMAKCLQGATRAMGSMNKKMNSSGIAKIMQEFQMQNDQMGMKEEMMGDAMDDAFADDDDEDEEDAILHGVLAELGVEIGNTMGSAPSSSVAEASSADKQESATAAAAGGGGGGEDLDAELQARLDNLRRT